MCRICRAERLKRQRKGLVVRSPRKEEIEAKRLVVRECSICKQEKSISQFHKRSSVSSGYDCRCKVCKSNTNKKWRADNMFHCLCKDLEKRAKKKGLPFDLTPEYLESIYSETCPVFGIPMTIFNEGKSTAEVDKFIPSKGYVKGNVTFLSVRANLIKSDSSLSELYKLIKWMEVKGVETIPKGSTSEANADGSGEV